MRIFVMGGGGFLGIPLCEALANAGHAVTAADTWWFGKKPSKRVTCMHADIRTVSTDPKAWGGVDAIFDLAGLSNDASAEINPELTRAINQEGAKRLALVAKRAGIKHYIYSSSASVYGNNEKQFLTERDACKPLTVYADSKVRVEDFLREQSDSDFQPVILRNATVFGVAKRMRFDLVVNGMVRAAWKDRRITIDGLGQQWRPLVHVGDVVGVFIDKLHSVAAHTENVVAFNHTVNEVARFVNAEMPGLTTAHKGSSDQRSYHLKPTIIGRTVPEGIKEVRLALEEGNIDADDESAWTVHWYKKLGRQQMEMA